MRLTLAAHLTAATDDRTITGTIVHYGTRLEASKPVIFAAGSIQVPDDPAAVKLLDNHDRGRVIGRGVTFAEAGDAIAGSFLVARTPAGDAALAEVADRVRDGLSVGVLIDDYTTAQDGTYHVTAARLEEVSLVAWPADQAARVAASTDPELEPELDDDPTPAVDHAAPTAPTTGEEMDTAPSVVPAVAASATHATPRRLPTPGEYIRAFGMRDAAEIQRVTAEVAHLVTNDVPGILPEPIIGPVIDTATGSRPVVDSSRRLPMPGMGQTFKRPKIVTHTDVAVQTNQKDELASRALEIEPLSIEKYTFGGVVNVSFQARDWTDPALLDILVLDLAKAYAGQTNSYTCYVLEDAVSQTTTLANNAAADAFVAALYNAAGLVNSAVNTLPDTLYASPDQWARLGSLVDTTKRPIFPSMGPVNAGGMMSVASFSGNPLGLRLVVDSQLTAGTLMVGASQFLETYEQVGGTVSVVEPSVLGFQVAYYGYFAGAVTEADAFCRLAPAS